jgi:Amt family ammonium transporter
MMQSFTMMCLITVLWAVYGYSQAFSEGNPFCGSLLTYFGMNDVGSAPNADYAATIPHQTYMVFQLMFAIITPGLICGAFAERMNFSALLLFTALWATFVYNPLAHMVWGKGGFFNAFLGGKIPALDFAGGTVVHISSGVSALVCALYLGKRVGYPREAMPPHNLTLAFIGACLLWFGWFGFNAGSAVAAGGLASSAFVATHFATAAAALGWAGAEWMLKGKPSVLGAISGAVTGLVAVTPASGFVGPMSGMAIGLIAGVCCYLAVTKVKARFGYDDSLDAFGVHGVGGTLGAILTGVFAHSAINQPFKDSAGKALPVGLIEGNVGQVINQIIATAASWTMAIIGTLIILWVVDKLVGLRMSEEDERQGIDITQHGEEGYNLI